MSKPTFKPLTHGYSKDEEVVTDVSHEHGLGGIGRVPQSVGSHGVSAAWVKERVTEGVKGASSARVSKFRKKMDDMTIRHREAGNKAASQRGGTSKALATRMQKANHHRKMSEKSGSAEQAVYDSRRKQATETRAKSKSAPKKESSMPAGRPILNPSKGGELGPFTKGPNGGLRRRGKNGKWEYLDTKKHTRGK